MFGICIRCVTGTCGDEMPFDGDDIEEGVFIFNPVDELLCIGDDGFDDTFT